MWALWGEWDHLCIGKYYRMCLGTSQVCWALCVDQDHDEYNFELSFARNGDPTIKQTLQSVWNVYMKYLMGSLSTMGIQCFMADHRKGPHRRVEMRWVEPHRACSHYVTQPTSLIHCFPNLSRAVCASWLHYQVSSIAPNWNQQCHFPHIQLLPDGHDGIRIYGLIVSSTTSGAARYPASLHWWCWSMMNMALGSLERNL